MIASLMNKPVKIITRVLKRQQIKEERDSAIINQSTETVDQEISFNSNKYGSKISNEILQWINEKYGISSSPIQAKDIQKEIQETFLADASL